MLGFRRIAWRPTAVEWAALAFVGIAAVATHVLDDQHPGLVLALATDVDDAQASIGAEP